MNKKTAILASFCLLVMTFAVSAQDNNLDKFIGEWTLDADKSELGERSRIESMTMKVSKTTLDSRNWLSVTKTAKRAERQEGERGIRGRMGRGRGGQIAGNNVETVNYALDGKETKSDINRGRMVGKATANIKAQKDGSMVIYQNTEFNSPRGLVKIKNTETWELSDNGKILTISIESETPRGNRNSKQVFSRTLGGIKGDPDGPVDPGKSRTHGVRRIKGGVVNGKALSLPSPEYPNAARTLGTKGAVSVEIIIGKEGNVLSAKALAGPALLRKASVDAAKKAKFAPTKLEGQPVEVLGIIVYNYQ